MQPLDALVFTALGHGALMALLVAAIFSAVLLVKSIIDFTRTGPEVAEEVLAHYRLYLAYTLARLVVFAFLITAFLAFLGVLAYAVGLILLDANYRTALAVSAAAVAFALLAGRRFAHTLLLSPGVIAASSLYSMTHFYPLWERLTPSRLRTYDIGLFTLAGIWLAAGLVKLAHDGAWWGFCLLTGIGALYAAISWSAAR